MKRLAMFLAFFLCLGLHLTMAQNVQITGTVTGSEDGQPLPGASVMVKGTNIGTTTDFQGKFVLSVPSDAKILVVSFIGLKTQETEIAGKSIIVVTLESDAKALDEVVVTALGIKRAEKSIGYSNTVVSNEGITKGKDRSVLNSLQGKVAGVQISSASGSPGASSRIILRGFSSLGGSNQPLFVVDGVPLNNTVINNSSLNGGYDFGNQINDLNPEDIETVNVVQGASGASLYGSRAANGVIIITTKKGKLNTNKTKVDITSSVIFDSPLRLPLMQNEFGQGWYDGTLAANLEENGSWGPKFDGKDRVYGHIVDFQQKIKPYKALESNISDFFETGKTFNNTVTISNGNENSTYYLSFENVSNNGIMPGDYDSYNRNNFSLKGSTKFKKNLSVSGSLNYVRKDSKFVPTGQQQSVLDGLSQIPRDISVVDNKDYKNKFNNVDNYFTVFASNPYFILAEDGNKFVDNRIYGNVELTYTILPWLSATARLGADVSNSTLKEWRAINWSTRASYEHDLGRVIESSFYTSQLNSDVILSANKDFGNFKVSGVIGHNFNQREARDQSAGVIGLDIPNFYNLSNSSATPTVDEAILKRRLVGVYGTLDVSWKDMVFVNLSARNDWSSTLPPDSRSFFYPGVSGSFVFTELLSPELKNILSFGKLRAGLSQVGNDASPYRTNSNFVQGGLTDGYRNLNFPLAGNINGFTVGNVIGNNKLQPEITTENEYGLELWFFKDRIKVKGTRYDRTTKDLIWNAALSASTGFTTQTLNLGQITNKGYELMINVTPIQTKDFEWSLFWSWSRNVNKLVELAPGLGQISLGGTSSVGFVARPGSPIGLFEGQVPQLSPDGKIVVNSSGLPIASTERGILGDAQYTYTAGLGTNLSWKGISFSCTFDIRQGGVMYSRTAEINYFVGNAAQTTFNDRQPFIMPNSVQYDANTGTYSENTVPIAGFDNNFNSYFNQTYSAGNFGRLYLIPKSFVKLREVNLSYSIPKKLLSKTFISNIEISLVGRNLLLWTPKSNTFVDPESTTFGNDLAADYGEYSSTPSTRSYGFSVKLGF